MWSAVCLQLDLFGAFQRSFQVVLQPIGTGRISIDSIDLREWDPACSDVTVHTVGTLHPVDPLFLLSAHAPLTDIQMVFDPAFHPRLQTLSFSQGNGL